MALRKRIWRIIKENKGRYIGIFILIFLGSFAFVAMTGVGDNLGNLVSGFAGENMQEDLSFSTDKPIEDIAALERQSGALIDSYRLKLPGGQSLSGGELRLLSPCTKVNIPAVKSGRALESPGDILLDPYFCSLHHLDIGGQIQVNGITLNIAGQVALPHYAYVLKNIYDVLPPSGFGIGLISDADFEAFPEAVTVYATYFEDRENINAQTARLHGLLTENGYALSEWVDAKNNKRIQMPWASITGVKTMSAPVSTAMFLLCCLIVGVMIWRMVKADGVVIGTLYAQGYRRRELTRHYMAIPIILSAAGGLAGTLLALPYIRPAVVLMTTTYYNVPITGADFSPVNIALGVLMPMAFLALSSYLVVRRVLGKTAGELMKGDEKKAKVNLLERGLRLERFKFNTKFQLREQVRSIPRLLFLLLGVGTASMLMLFGFTINHSMNVVLDGGMDDTYNFALEYSFKEIQHGDIPEGAEPFNAIRCYPEGKESAEFYVMAVEPDSAAITLRDARGDDLSKEQVNITYPLASRLRLEAGDTIRFVNKMDGKSYSLVIDGIAETYSGQFIYMPLDWFNRMTGQVPGSFSGLLADRELDIDERLLAGVKDLRDVNSMGDLAMSMTAMILFITIIAGLIGAVIIFLVTSLIIEESRGAISLLKIFGYRGKEVKRLILGGSTPVVIAGFLLGIPVMLASANALYGYLGEMINLVLPMIVSPLYVLISFVLIFSVYELTKLLCGRKLAKISMSEALKAGTE